MKNGKITSCTYLKPFKSAYGEMHSHTITLDNGDSGEINSKEPNPPFLAAGQTLWYDITPNGKYAPKIKRMQAPDTEEKRGAGQRDAQRIDALEAEVEKLKQVIKTLVQKNKLIYIAEPALSMQKPVVKMEPYEREIINAPSPVLNDDDSLPF